MTLNKYQNEVGNFAKPYMTEQYCIIGIGGEAGEVLEWYKKAILKSNMIKEPLTEQDLIEELGDVLFYLTRLAAHRGYDLQAVMEANIKKHKQEKKEKKP